MRREKQGFKGNLGAMFVALGLMFVTVAGCAVVVSVHGMSAIDRRAN